MIPTFEVKETGLGLGLGRVDGSVNARVRDWSRKGSPSSSQLRGSMQGFGMGLGRVPQVVVNQSVTTA